MSVATITPATELDLAAIRAQFPILARTIHGRPLAYLDSAASAQKPESVISAMANFQRTSYANVHRGLHTLANEATEAFEAARAKVAAFLNAGSADEIIFTKSATEAINLVAAGISQSLKPGDEILISELEHHANIVPWHMAAERSGAVLKWAAINPEGSLDMKSLAALIGPRTKMVAISHMSNVLGCVQDVAAIVAMARDVGAQVLIDGCQGVVHLDVDVQALGADFYVFAPHKLYGPTGIGVLHGKPEALHRLPPWQGGGEMIEIVSKEKITYNVPPFRFEAGTPAITEAVGLSAAIDWVQAQDRAALRAHEHELLTHAMAALRGVNGITLYGTAPGKGGIIAFNIAGAHPHDVAQVLDRYGVAVRAGHHCAQPLMTALGVTATARASLAAYTSREDIDQFVQALEKARDFLL
ncbi:cysteine desulfurase [Candidatus Phycosocius bacilliformis]|uniref:Cysteine desulfurase n=1 Tax=Candidatus Phycosocius bacilliformis TaxID=1445552 RepID=A0A2P2EBD4_9PROT|nr:cysteine desulfurase [Candidatus Phycosocius bacilliformis]GBF58364.1 cysteine desulfurase [Candidatus Phycosocius bacilliformis]